ncbi:hypothetical protein ACFE04_004215 [Oxalis oulophora]
MHHPLNLSLTQNPVMFFPGKFKTPPTTTCKPSRSLSITCGLRGGPRRPLWSARVLSTESIQAVQSLKLSKSSPTKIQTVFNTKINRLIKSDLLDALGELLRQNELLLALKVFEFVQQEVWYEPDVFLYCDMIQLMGKNQMIEEAEELFLSLEKNGLKPNARAFNEMIGAYFQVGMTEKAMQTYARMKESDCAPDRLTFMILIRNLEKAGEEELVATLKEECFDYVDFPKKFLEEVAQRHVSICISIAWFCSIVTVLGLFRDCKQALANCYLILEQWDFTIRKAAEAFNAIFMKDENL